MTSKPPRRESKLPRREPPRHGVARVISKLGLASRTQAAQWVREGRVRVGRVHDLYQIQAEDRRERRN